MNKSQSDREGRGDAGEGGKDENRESYLESIGDYAAERVEFHYPRRFNSENFSY